MNRSWDYILPLFRCSAPCPKRPAKDSQIFISTQSIDIVNQFSPQDIIVCDNDGEETVFNRLGDMDLSAWLEDYTLGELWEKNVFGGNP